MRRAIITAVLSGIVACSSRGGDVHPEPSIPATTSAPITPATAATSVASSATPALPFEPKRIALEDGAMGTRVVISSFTTPAIDEPALKQKLVAAFTEIKRLERLMTTWKEDSEVSGINRAAGESAAKVGPETLGVIEKSLWISKESRGVFDISFEAMHGLWKFDEDRVDAVPAKAKIEEVRRLIDYRKILVDHDASTVKLDKKGMRISLGGIAKGFAVDRAAAALEASGVTSFFIQAGGDLLVRGQKPDGSRFRVGIRDPRGKGKDDYFATIDIQDHAFSTAGDYERFFVKDGNRYHHIIDPRTGYPATASRSVTVWAKDALLADSVDDAVFILGPKEGLALVERLPDVGAVIVDKDNKVWISKRLEGLVHKLRDPTDGI